MKAMMKKNSMEIYKFGSIVRVGSRSIVSTTFITSTVLIIVMLLPNSAKGTSNLIYPTVEWVQE